MKYMILDTGKKKKKHLKILALLVYRTQMHFHATFHVSEYLKVVYSSMTQL